MNAQGTASRERDNDVQVTADALVSLRANRGFQRGFGIEDPCAAHFVTRAGRSMAAMAQSVDPVYAPFNLARYRYLGEHTRDAAGHYPQLLRLGVGFDARAHWDAGVRDAGWDIYEVDFAHKLRYRDEVLERAGFAQPEQVHPIGCDLTDPELKARLLDAGYRPGLATLAVMEGVSFFLPGKALRHAIAPETLGLGTDSTLLLDVWSAARIHTMNRRVIARLGRGLFGDTGLGDDPLEIAASMRELGYTTVDVHALCAIANDYALDYADDDVPDSWFIVEAHVDR